MKKLILCTVACGIALSGCASDKTIETTKTANGTITTTSQGRGSGVAKMGVSALLFGVPGLVGYGIYHHIQKNKDAKIAGLQGQLEAHPVCKKYSNSYDATVNCLNSFAAKPASAAARR